ncbi:hypothetical protein Q8F55_003738 [Vanrija albida]|uniref:Calcipressin n=1 Tax=Vanrija albida TaxID=181172 RepID=A0ABR3Q5K6_9TREE
MPPLPNPAASLPPVRPTTPPPPTAIQRANTPPPLSFAVPPPPELEPSAPRTSEPTNTLALLLPTQALFAPEPIAVLRAAFEAYGRLVHWAPVRAMGRVILVYDDDGAAARAKREGDLLRIELGDEAEAAAEAVEARSPAPAAQAPDSHGYFDRKRKAITLRVYALPPTPLSPVDAHLRPPEAERNFLISPPGSPPEGWEPVEEEGPNLHPLADDLRRALESLQISAAGGREVLVDEGGVRVEVEDTSAGPRRERWEGEEEEYGVEEPWGGPGIWEAPSQARGDGGGGGGGAGLGGGGAGLGAAPLPALSLGEVLSPSGKVRIVPTARPPV